VVGHVDPIANSTQITVISHDRHSHALDRKSESSTRILISRPGVRIVSDVPIEGSQSGIAFRENGTLPFPDRLKCNDNPLPSVGENFEVRFISRTYLKQISDADARCSSCSHLPAQIAPASAEQESFTESLNSESVFPGVSGHNQTTYAGGGPGVLGIGATAGGEDAGGEGFAGAAGVTGVADGSGGPQSSVSLGPD
jgi:hypothetical protein